MSIFVAGGTGFIGSRLVRLIARHGMDVTCMMVNPSKDRFADLGKQVSVIRGDITRFEDVLAAMLSARPRRAINLSYMHGSGNPPHEAVQRNVLGMDNFFEAARLLEVPRIVYASTLGVHGLQKEYGERPVREDESLYGTGQYATHKIFNEAQARDYTEKFGMSITGVRPANVTGFDKVRGSVDHVRCIVEPARGNSITLPHMDLMRLLIHVDDIAELFWRVLMSDAPKHPIYNSGGHPISLGDLAGIVRTFIPDAKINFSSESGGRDQSGVFLLDNTRMMQEFDLPYLSVRACVERVIADVREMRAA